MRRYRHRDWKDPFSWFSWAQQGRPNVLFKYQPAGASIGAATPTFTRADASTCATYVDSNGVVQTVAANVLRNSHYIRGVRTTLLEGSRQNICLRSEALNTAPWVKSGALTVTEGYASAAGLSFSRLVGTFGGDYLRQGITFTGDGVKAIAVYAKQSGSATGTCVLDLYDTIAAAYRLQATLTVAGGGAISCAIGATGTLLQTQALASGVYRFLFATNSVTAANAHNLELASGGTVGDILFAGGQAENAAFPSSYIATAGAAVTRAADAFSLPFKAVPQAMTVYFKAIDVGESTIGAATRTGECCTIGSTVAESLYFSTPNGKYSVNHISAAGSGASTQTAAVNAPFDTVEGLATLTAGGTPQLTYSFNGAAEVSPAAGTTRALDSTWSATTVWVTGRTAGAATFLAFQKLVIASGVQSLATMRAL